jgi:L-amino acid N-acyltransferase YncA
MATPVLVAKAAGPILASLLLAATSSAPMLLMGLAATGAGSAVLFTVTVRRRRARHPATHRAPMTIRTATPNDAEAIAAIYAPVVVNTPISFELEAPSPDEMRSRIASTLQRLPWLVSLDADGRVDGYVYAGRHRERAAYQWAVDTSAYVREDARGKGVGRRLYERLFEELVALGYFQAFAGIALPNAASVGLHEAMGFEPLGVYRNVGFKMGRWRDVGWWQKTLREPTGAPKAPRAFRS